MIVSQQQYTQWQQQLQSNIIFRRFWQFWSNYAFVFFIPAFALVGLRAYPYQTIAIAAIAFFVARGVIVMIINHWYHRQRPYQRYEFEPITSRFFSLKTTIPNSFPSRHTTAYAAVALAIFMIHTDIGSPLLIATAFTGMARVVLGFHYPSDILAGWFIGSVIGISTAAFLVPVLFT